MNSGAIARPTQRSSRNERYVSPIWQAAIDKYFEELRKEGVKESAIDQDLWSIHSPNDLLQQIQDLAPMDTSLSGSWMGSLRRLEPILLSLNDFAAVITLALGMNGQVAAVIWGSIRLILKFAQPVSPELLDMFEELGRALPRFRQYEQELPMTHSLEDALLNTESKTAETVEAIKDLQASQHIEMKLPCYMIPYGLNVKFFGRSVETEVLKRSLQPESDFERLKVIAVYGTGGVGKTQLALHYANTSMELYDVVIWIPAETQIKVTQALSEFAKKLGMGKAEAGEDDYPSIQRVKDWLNTSRKTFLLIFDNVEHHDLLEQIWPASNRGSIIITCRSHSVASKRTTEVMHLQCFSAQTGMDVFYSLTGRQPSSEADALAAEELFQLLGGLPLAMVQLSEFMTDGEFSYCELLNLFKKSAKRILARLGAPIQYEHTLGTVWDVSFERLSTESRTLLLILTFFDPDLIPESILSNKRAGITDPALQFLFDDLE
ncbi:uncharacterized protein ATNIH1004_002831 [Aspergillus tanneri]|uniref:AAA+ ATPase domain-containing protein n=1 Tax=Aspergillus tanneri TaxID=1220188 RepID=A0A5M9MXQ8_9EURO|nr:uncharacterized protein ATNIH1004_002831 [Aspergillus tanneri]KAA8650150.1 hypothetical protein ATNIH1004_002831 [Aspergillus tanneri]